MAPLAWRRRGCLCCQAVSCRRVDDARPRAPRAWPAKAASVIPSRLVGKRRQIELPIWGAFAPSCVRSRQKRCEVTRKGASNAPGSATNLAPRSVSVETTRAIATEKPRSADVRHGGNSAFLHFENPHYKAKRRPCSTRAPSGRCTAPVPIDAQTLRPLLACRVSGRMVRLRATL